MEKEALAVCSTFCLAAFVYRLLAVFQCRGKSTACLQCPERVRACGSGEKTAAAGVSGRVGHTHIHPRVVFVVEGR